MRRYFFFGPLAAFTTLLLAACSTGAASTPLVPATDRPTFLFFYTDN
ncbi:MAG: hypothetical protein HY326_02105 [Chloroflexi bacterium]|nr:hypothetical protein [Chloroflexota bacterium]